VISINKTSKKNANKEKQAKVHSGAGENTQDIFVSQSGIPQNFTLILKKCAKMV